MTGICQQCFGDLEIRAFHPTRRKVKFCSFRCGKIYLTKRPAGKMSALERKKLQDERASIIGGLSGP